MKIKTKKQLNLPQLLEWAIRSDSDVLNKLFKSQSMTIQFDGFGNPNIESKLRYLPADEKFDVEVEEEITEDTVIPKMLEKSFDAYQNVVLDIQVNQSINTVKENAEVLTLHIINDDDTHTLIWRDGKLVE